MRRNSGSFSSGVALAVLVPLIIIPLGFLVYGTFRSKPPRQGGEWTFDNYSVFLERDFLSLLKGTLTLVVATTIFSVAVAALLALAIARWNLPFAKALDTLTMVPAYVPNLIGAIAWSFLLSPSAGLLNTALGKLGMGPINIYSWGGVIGVSALYAIPVAYLYIRPALLSIDPSLEEAASIAGANKTQTALKILFPIAKPAISSAAMVVLVGSISNFAVVQILGTPANIDVLARRIIQLASSGPVDPGKAAVLGVALAASAVLGLAIMVQGTKANQYVTIGARHSTRQAVVPRSLTVLGTSFFVVYITVTVILPTAVFVLGSFQPYLGATISNKWTLSNYQRMIEYPSAMQAIQNSVMLGLGAALITGVLAVVLGYVIVRRPGKLSKILEYISMTPLAVPHMVFGVAMIWMWVAIPSGLYGTKWILLAAYVALFLPYAVRASVSAYQRLDPVLEEAAHVFGGRKARVTRSIVMPLIVPGVIGGAIIVLYHTLQELGASLLLYPTGEPVMTVAIWNMADTGAYAQLFALAVVYLAVTLVLVSVFSRISRKYARL